MGVAVVVPLGAAPGTDVRPIGEVRLIHFNNGLLIGRAGETRSGWAGSGCQGQPTRAPPALAAQVNFPDVTPLHAEFIE